MIGFDTNVLVRFLVRDDPVLGCHRTATFDGALEGEEGFLLL